MHLNPLPLNTPQNFSGQNLQGRSFKGRKDLAGADFSYADIRGADFTDAILRGANFSHTRAGLQSRWKIGLVIVSLLLAALSGFASAYAGAAMGIALLSKNPSNVFSGVVIVITLVIFVIVTIRKGLVVALGAVSAAALVAGAVAGVATGVATARAGDMAVVVGWAVAGATARAVAGAAAVAVIGAVVVAGAMAVAAIGAVMVAGAMAVGATGVLAGVVAWTGSTSVGWVLAAAVVGVVAVAGLSAYVSWRALTGDRKHAFMRTIAIAFTATGGTSFRGADLTDADFTWATLKSTNFRGANLTRTNWFQTQKLDRAVVGRTYLNNPQVRQLVITREGQDKNLDGLNLRGVNLQGANLTDASFIGADLSEANLQDANLSRAKLKQTQLDATDLTGACLTGACIEDWGITPETKLDGVQCDYIFMRNPTKDNPNPRRKPDNWADTFKDGDFADFIAPLIKTLLDLYHNQQANPRAVQLAFNELVENNPGAELSVIAVETRGKNNDKLLIRAKVAEDANTSELSAEYLANYNRYKALPSEILRSLLEEKDKTILMLAGQVDHALKTAIERPSIYAQTYQNQGDTMPDKSSEINISGVTGSSISGIAGGEISGVAGQNMTGVAASVSGNVTQSIGQLEKADEPEAPKLADLLKQLQAAIEADASLSAQDKAEALEQVKSLAEAGQNPKEQTMQKTAKSAIRMLKGIMADLPAVATLVETTNKLLPAIAHLFGLG